ncbi:hypothetical protein K469DRAFT_664189 [Zopfia rhizophila CBS 207.26]|uniref:Zn(2)-C6 fungal-type domain-containing protein n=1 Tax=Zopfia rhizophila CBS 207.26 TaxID=1314779 RepID=A0A6A6E900_9PEZI|nr:hypothetical protein K469DRAFT_664189 [Zopfia rhizophila CBS 207.26]
MDVDPTTIETPQPRPYHPRAHRVCLACRRRKVRCDKKQPCQNCTKANLQCVFPLPGSGFGHQAVLDGELVGRLHRLESTIKALVTATGESNVDAAIQSIVNRFQTVNKTQTPPPPTESGSPRVINISSQQASPESTSSCRRDDSSPWTPYGTAPGRLVKDEGRDRYISGLFWSTLHSQFDEAPEIADGSEYGDYSSSSPPPYSEHDYFFDSNFSSEDLSTFHPPQGQRYKSWEFFKTSVLPLARLLHVPSIEPRILEALESLRGIPRPLEAIIFVVYYGAGTSISSEECFEEFLEDQSVLLTRYRICVQKALARANLVRTDDILVLQAFVLFLVLLRRHDPRLSWNLTGLAVRLAQSLGMHRDGASLDLSIFEAEMRRRIWWNICLLDTPASEDHSCSSTILEISSFDASLPRNLDDTDFDLHTPDFPPEREGMTDMSFTLSRCISTDLWRTMIDIRRATCKGKSFASMSTSEKVDWVNEQQAYLEQRFLRDCSSAVPLHWLTATHVRCIMSNLRLFIYHSLTPDANLTEEDRDQIFATAIEGMEHSYRLHTDRRSRNFQWLLSCYQSC